MDLAIQSTLGRQMGTYYMVRGILISMAPLLGGLLWGWNPISPFILGGAISAVGFLWFVLDGILFQSKAPSEEVLTQSTPEAE